jgi:SAM-dependent methyltransferase
MADTDLFARRATLSRSLRLQSEFRFEQRDPARFYGALADDTATMVADLWRGATGAGAAGATVLDVGGGPGYFASAFRDAGLTYIGVEPDAAEMHAGPASDAAAATYVRASGTALPFADASVDICLSSNVAEHVAQPWRLGREMLRVTRPGGLVVLSYTVWLGPFGGHETGRWHYLGGARAAARYARRHGHRPKNDYGSSLFAVSVADGLQWAASTGVPYLAFPRYHPRWAWWMTRVAVLREFGVSNLVLVLRPPIATGSTFRAT